MILFEFTDLIMQDFISCTIFSMETGDTPSKYQDEVWSAPARSSIIPDIHLGESNKACTLVS